MPSRPRNGPWPALCSRLVSSIANPFITSSLSIRFYPFAFVSAICAGPAAEGQLAFLRSFLIAPEETGREHMIESAQHLLFI